MGNFVCDPITNYTLAGFCVIAFGNVAPLWLFDRSCCLWLNDDALSNKKFISLPTTAIIFVSLWPIVGKVNTRLIPLIGTLHGFYAKIYNWEVFPLHPQNSISFLTPSTLKSRLDRSMVMILGKNMFHVYKISQVASTAVN